MHRSFYSSTYLRQLSRSTCELCFGDWNSNMRQSDSSKKTTPEMVYFCRFFAVPITFMSTLNSKCTSNFFIHIGWWFETVKPLFGNILLQTSLQNGYIFGQAFPRLRTPPRNSFMSHITPQSMGKHLNLPFSGCFLAVLTNLNTTNTEDVVGDHLDPCGHCCWRDKGFPG